MVLEASAHIDHCADDGCIACVGVDLVHERLIHLQSVDRKLSQITQTGMTGPEVIDCETHPHSFEFLEHRGSEPGMLHEVAFRQFEFEIARLQASILQDGPNTFKEISAAELDRRNVNSQTNGPQPSVLPCSGLPARFA